VIEYPDILSDDDRRRIERAVVAAELACSAVWAEPPKPGTRSTWEYPDRHAVVVREVLGVLEVVVQVVSDKATVDHLIDQVIPHFETNYPTTAGWVPGTFSRHIKGATRGASWWLAFLQTLHERSEQRETAVIRQPPIASTSEDAAPVPRSLSAMVRQLIDELHLSDEQVAHKAKVDIDALKDLLAERRQTAKKTRTKLEDFFNKAFPERAKEKRIRLPAPPPRSR